MPDAPIDLNVAVTDEASAPIRETTPEARLANAAMEAIRIEYMRGLPDAYAGGPRGRELSWDRLRDAIEHYALRIADTAVAESFRRLRSAGTPSDPAPTMNPAVDPPADTGPVDDGSAPADQADAEAQPARRPTSRRPRATRTTDQAEAANHAAEADTETREEEA